MYTPKDDRLIRALRASRDARLTGGLRVETETAGVTLFFDVGQLYFATIDGQLPTTVSFGANGITRDMLDEASHAPRANDRFADALMSVGAAGPSVRGFGLRSVLDGLTAAAQLDDARFSAHELAHPYGPAFTFDADELLETIGVLAAKEKPAPPEPPAPVISGWEETQPQSIGFRRRTGLRAAAAAAAQHD